MQEKFVRTGADNVVTRIGFSVVLVVQPMCCIQVYDRGTILGFVLKNLLCPLNEDDMDDPAIQTAARVLKVSSDTLIGSLLYYYDYERNLSSAFAGSNCVQVSDPHSSNDQESQGCGQG